MTLYLKYRPETLDELDLTEVRESLKKIVSSGNIPHAFLFSGPKGTGKTSAARILAKIVNCERNKPRVDASLGEPCNKCDQCISIDNGSNLDIVEIDAASHRGIDDVRVLRDAVKLSPAAAEKKVYIIDEAHMLTTEASNALLKTLEEPPSHVIFILATTNPEKLIETIRSRTTPVVFRKATTEELLSALVRVIKGEKLDTKKDVLELIAKASDGSFRDAIKLLEQIITEGVLKDKQRVEDYLFRNKVFNPDDFLKVLSEGDVKTAISMIEDAVTKGVSAKNMTGLLIDRLKKALLAEVGIGNENIEFLKYDEVVYLIKLFSEAHSQIYSAVLEQIPLEIAVVEWSDKKIKYQRSNIKDQEEREEIKIGYEELKTQKGKNDSGESADRSNSMSSVSSDRAHKTQLNGSIEEIWTRVLAEIHPKNASTEALLRASKPIEYDGKILTLGVYYRFHKERLEGNPHRDILEGVVASLTGNQIRVVCRLTEPPSARKIEDTEIKKGESLPQSNGAGSGTDPLLTEAEDSDIIKVAKEIFGS